MRGRRNTIGAAAAGAALALFVAACGSSSKPAATSTSAPPGAVGSITVLAASSLTKAFTALASEFEAAHPGAKVNLNFASSSTLVEQIQNGAPADVFASADEKNMQKLQHANALSGT